MCTLFLLGLSIFTVLMALPSPVALVLGRALVGFFGAVVFLAAQRSTSLLFGRERQALITGFLLMVGNISTAIGTYPLVLFIARYGFRELFYILATVATILGSLVFSLSRDPGGRARGLSILDVYRGLKRAALDLHMWGVVSAAISAYTVVAFQSS